MATSVGELYAKLRLDASGFFSGIDAAVGKLKWFGVAVAGAAGYSIKLASDFEETTNVINVAFGKSAAEIEDWASTTGKAVGRSTQQMRASAGVLQSMLAPMVGNAEAAKEMSKGLAQLSIDMGSFLNVADEEALNALRSAISGETEPMKRFGVVMTEAALKAYMLEQGITGTIKSMTEAEKVTLRYNYLLSRTSFAHGDAAETIGSFANQMKALKAQLEELGVAIGSKLLPAVTSFVSSLREMAESLTALKIPDETVDIIKLTAAITVGVGVVLSFGKILAVAAAAFGLLKIAVLGAVVSNALFLASITALQASLVVLAGPIIGAFVLAIGALAVAWHDWNERAKDREWLDNLQEGIELERELLRAKNDAIAGQARFIDMQKQLNAQLAAMRIPTAMEAFAKSAGVGVTNPWLALLGAGGDKGEAPTSLDPEGDSRRKRARDKRKAEREAEQKANAPPSMDESKFEGDWFNLFRTIVHRRTSLEIEAEEKIAKMRREFRTKDAEDYAKAWEADLKKITEAEKKARKDLIAWRKKQEEAGAQFASLAGGGAIAGMRGDVGGVAQAGIGIAGMMGGVSAPIMSMISTGAQVFGEAIKQAAQFVREGAEAMRQAFEETVGVIGKKLFAGFTSTFGDALSQMQATFAAIIGAFAFGTAGVLVSLAALTGGNWIAIAAMGPLAGAAVLVGVSLAGLAGPLGALTIGLFTLSTQTKNYAKFQQLMSLTAAQFVDALEPAWRNLQPIAYVGYLVAQGLSGLFGTLVPSIAIARTMFDAFKSIGLSALLASYGLNRMIGYILEGTATVLKWASETSGVAMNAGIDAALTGASEAHARAFDIGGDTGGGGFGGLIKALSDLTYDGAFPLLDALLETKKGFDSLNDSMANIPAWYRTGLTRHEAGGGGGGGGSGGGTNVSGDVVIHVYPSSGTDGRSLAEQLHQELKNLGQRKSGATMAMASAPRRYLGRP